MKRILITILFISFLGIFPVNSETLDPSGCEAAYQTCQEWWEIINKDIAAVDNCPDDPNKTEPGVCGCGVVDTDSDRDGTADCIDNCPKDFGKTDPGACGCGVADIDSNGDGTMDCNETEIEGKLPIFLAHGWYGSEAVFRTLKTMLVEAGYPPDYIYGISIREDNNKLCSQAHVDEIEAAIDKVIAETGFTQVDVIGHSRGGSDLLDLMYQRDGIDKVRNWVSLSGHNNGCEQQRLWPSYPEDRTPGDTKYTSLWSDGDRMVNKGQAHVDGAKNVNIPGLSHSQMNKSQTIMPYLLDALNGGGFNDGKPVN
jgi:pimeloyl-ACP methyl ester carboxylesterase